MNYGKYRYTIASPKLDNNNMTQQDKHPSCPETQITMDKPQ